MDYRPIGAPTQEAPFGEIFEAFAARVPHDVLIGQRAPGLFARPTAAKLNLWWSHDLALRRHLPAMSRQLWNTNAVLCVSEYHKAQVAQVYGLKPERIAVVPNGVDGSLFTGGNKRASSEKRRARTLVYSSRPERGLEHLVGQGLPGDPPAIMELLAAADPEITLKVCGYDNTAPELAEYYAALAARCQGLPNVEWLGPLSKPELARLMEQAWLHVYPTTFEEVSCITAGETQCAGTPIVTSPVAALPETLRDAAVLWVPLMAAESAAGQASAAESGDGVIDRQAYADAILALAKDTGRYDRLHGIALERGATYTWHRAADAVENTVAQCFGRMNGDPARLARHLMRLSDITPLREHLAALPAETRPKENDELPGSRPILEAVRAELTQCYAFAEAGGLADHYRACYDYEAARGVVYGPEDLTGNPRFEAVAARVAALPARAAVLDYGCAHGHYTINLARRFPHLSFTGIDLVPGNIAKAKAWADLEAADGKPLDNVRFLEADLTQGDACMGLSEQLTLPDLLLAAEVLEHVPDPTALAGNLASLLAPDGRMLITTPYGPWEAQGFAEHHPWRAHLHHMEAADLEDLFGHHPGFALQAVPAGTTPQGEPLGSYLVTYRKPRLSRDNSGRVHIARKLAIQAPRETLSVCMIVRPDSDTLTRTLKSLAPIADQVVLGVDAGPQGHGDIAPIGEQVRPLLATLAPACALDIFPITSPRTQGFDAARNATLARASGDWIFWIDDDEELLWPERLPKYLRDNGYDAYAVKQHHYAVEPGGIIKTDLPCRIFRNRRGFRFFGVVHEHPELGLNQGAGQVLLLPDLAICHNGYVTDDVRRQRFQRNLPLMRRDRATHPDRLLGRFLWIRDLAHLNRFELEQHGAITPRMRAQAEEAVHLWRGLLEEHQVRMAIDVLPYYSEAAQLLAGEGISCQLALGLNRLGLGDLLDQPTTLQGTFLTPTDIQNLTQALLNEKTQNLDGKYL